MPDFDRYLPNLTILISGGLSGSLVTMFVASRRNKRLATLETVLSPPLIPDEDKAKNLMQCFCRLTVQRSHDSFRMFEIVLRREEGHVRYWGSRIGIDFNLIGKDRLKIDHLREGDVVTVMFLTPSCEINDDSDKLIDVNSDPHLFVQRNISVWY